ncbi:glutamate racemase [Bombilactobacillus folatiphilus]|uniref:Glutamate racemase n=1 Tax=Bombilactobacillus folatiphilus TaxID=2923362 RepID=A0ABY4PB09_9LACO|nr:glutamate racemase [Bombilactobacillus folatiphilus]UQS82467.1 glutamate racemase [Bombilactobacillus folatiphilus]
MDNRPIGFLDSGVGGLTAVKAALQLLPQESTVFIGDQARLPYGPRPIQQVQTFTKQLVQFLVKRDVKVIVIACNTATAAALTWVRQQFTLPIFGVIAAGSRQAVALTKQQQIGLIATQGTIASKAYEREIQQLAPQVTVQGLATPEFVTLVEQGQYHDAQILQQVQKILSPLTKLDLDTLILGCTHFPLLQPTIQQVMGASVQLVDAGAQTVQELQRFLVQEQLQADPDSPVSHHYYTTGQPDSLQGIAQEWLEETNLVVKEVDLGAN